MISFTSHKISLADILSDSIPSNCYAPTNVGTNLKTCLTL